MVSTKTSLFRFQTVPIKIPFSIRLHQSSVGNRSSMTARIKCSVGSNIGIHLPPTFPKKNNFGEKASLFWFQTAPMKIHFRSLVRALGTLKIPRSCSNIDTLAYSSTISKRKFPLFRSQIAPIKIPFPFRSNSIPFYGVENGKMVDDRHWSNGQLQIATTMRDSEWRKGVRFDSISDAEQLGKRGR